MLNNDVEEIIGDCAGTLCPYDIAKTYFEKSIVSDIVTACKASEDIEFEEPIKFS